MDQSRRKESLSEETSQDNKCCAHCKTTKTPLWRSGPAGPKSLCNACGIRYRKRRGFGVDVGVNKDSGKSKENSTSTTTTKNNSSSSSKLKNGSVNGKDGKLREALRVRLMALGKEVAMLQRQRSPMRRHSRSKKMGEEEQAAVLLMALSYGSLLAWKR